MRDAQGRSAGAAQKRCRVTEKSGQQEARDRDEEENQDDH
jgi:hypothetical protein